MNKKRFSKIVSMLVVTAIMLLSIGAITASAATISSLDLVFTGPGEDSSTEMNITWHSDVPTAKIIYTLATDTAFANATTITVTGTPNIGTFTKSESFYKCEAHLTNLIPDTKYIYKVSNASKESEIYTFKTAGNDTNYSFAWLSDLHANQDEYSYTKVVPKLMTYMENAAGEPMDFILFSGDAVDYGAVYSDWLQWDRIDTPKNFMIAFGAGNHEYYNYKGGKIKHVTNKWFMDCVNNPNNGVEELNETTYWFIYNNVMFISLDTNSAEASELSTTNGGLNYQQAWFKKVLKEQAGNYQYIVVYQHYPYFESDDDGGAVCSYGGYSSWYKLYDEYGVDFALSSDSHTYIRTERLYNNKVATSDKQGTIYITSPMITTETSLSVKNSPQELIATYGIGGSKGGGYFTVTPEGLTYTLISTRGVEKDTVTIVPKREPVAKKGNSTNSDYGYALMNMDLISGYTGDDPLKEANAITRQEAIAMIISFMNVHTDANAMTEAEIDSILSGYTDASSVASWAKKFVAYAIKTGISTGTSATTWSPTKNITGREFATLLANSLKYKIGSDFAYNTALSDLAKTGGFSATSAIAANLATLDAASLTRGNCFAIMYGSLGITRKDTAKTHLIYLIDGGRISQSVADANFK